MAGQIIILHGASSSGKSTLAKALQDKIELPFLHLSIDHLRDSGALPKRADFQWSDMRGPFFDGFHRALAAFAEAGNSLIVEHILDTAEWVENLKQLLAPYDVFFVGLHCRAEVLRQRELARGNRPIGSAEKDHATIHVGRRYDLELDGEGLVEGNVEVLMQSWRSGIRVSDFALRG